MHRTRIRLRTLRQTFWRIYSPFNVLMLIGRLLRQRAIRSLSLASVGLLTVLWRAADGFWDWLDRISSLNTEQLEPVMETGLLALGLLFPIGLALTGLYNAAALRHERKARMNNLILTGDYKKTTLVLPYLHQLWDEVYRPELRYAYRLPVNGRLEFVAAAYDGIRTAAPQSLQDARLGFPLALTESWTRRGLFTDEDHLADMVEYNQILRDVRRIRYGLIGRYLLSNLKGEPQPSLWQSLTVRKVQLLIGQGLQRLNERWSSPAQSHYFRAEHFIWPSPELDAEVGRAFPDTPALSELRLCRRALFRRVFSDDWRMAATLVFYMFRNDYKAALLLRMEFDPEFVLSRRGRAELRLMRQRYGLELFSKRKLAKYRRRVQEAITQVDAWLLAHREQHLTPAERRALVIAVYVDHQGSGRALRKFLAAQEATPAQARVLREVLINTPRFSRGLRKVRECHVLARYQIRAYQLLVWQLGEYNTSHARL